MRHIFSLPAVSEDADLDVMERLQKKIEEEKQKMKAGDKEMLFKEYPMLGDYTDKVDCIDNCVYTTQHT